MKNLDSSAVFRQENYLGRIREVGFMRGPAFVDTILGHVIENAGREGYKPISLSIVNIVDGGGPERNEPTEAILCENAQEKKGIIVKKHVSPHFHEYRFYPPGEWNYIP